MFKYHKIVFLILLILYNIMLLRSMVQIYNPDLIFIYKDIFTQRKLCTINLFDQDVYIRPNLLKVGPDFSKWARPNWKYFALFFLVDPFLKKEIEKKVTLENLIFHCFS